MNRFGVDTGGTFTDVVGDDGRIAKVPSTRHDPASAVRRGISELVGERSSANDRSRPVGLAHGTTVATNALLERRGGRVALVTNGGMTDLVEIGRQDRPSLYDIWVDRPAPLVGRDKRYEVSGRLDASGKEVRPLDRARITALAGQLHDVESVAVCLLHADLDGGHECEVVRILAGHGLDVTGSADVSPEFREYERTVTTLLNAYLRPACRTYLQALEDLADEVTVMTSAGGMVPIAAAAELPVALLLSGPAGGVRAAAATARACGFPDAITFDMGGTSTDVCLVLDGAPAPAAQRAVGGFPVRQPSLDVHTIGAGGGSIAKVDAGGALTVGPQSAGAEPGPACYGRGGTEPTVTDADLIAGRIPQDAELPGIGRLDLHAAHGALDGSGVSADGVIAVVDAAMEQALRAESVGRGVDPTTLALVAFGGAGPLHACALADALGMPTVIVPARAGVLSAVGLLAAPRQHDLVRSWPTPPDHRGLDDALAELADAAAKELVILGVADAAAISVETAVDCRYAGQSHELRVPTLSAFVAEHIRRNGYDRAGTAVEVVALRATARREAPVDIGDLPAPVRTSTVGPAVIAEPDCTVWVPAGWRADPDERTGALILTREVDHEPTLFLEARTSPGEDGAATNDRALGPAALQVLMSRLTGVADEMGAVLRRAAFSPNIKERADCSAALFTADGTLLVQAEHIPVHLGSMPASVRAAIDAFGDAIRPGDQVILNDPFAGGTHLNDITIVAPVFASVDGGGLCGWVANRAHHADLGGAAPGSIPADAVEIQQEGLRIPPVLFGPAVRAIVLASSRTPEERGGDLDAQIGANLLGAKRFAALAHEPLDEVIAYGERRMRAALAALDEGTWCFDDVLDSFGPSPDQQRPTTIRLAVTAHQDEIRFDFTGTDPQTRGNVNAVEAVTVSAVAFALRSALDPSIPANGGAMRAVHVVAPAGTVVAAVPPAAVGAGNVEVSQRVADVCLGALAQLVPDRVGAASQGTMNNILIGGTGWVYYETLAGGQGGRPLPGWRGMSGVHTAMTNTSQADYQSGPGVPGQSGIHTCMTNTKNTPIEALERAFPMRVLRYRLRRGSGGAGSAPGGEGIERDLEMLEDVTVSLITERRVSQPWGLAGGEPGAVGENWLLPGGDESRAERLLDKCTIRMGAGDVLRMLTPGGGGWGRARAD